MNAIDDADGALELVAILTEIMSQANERKKHVENWLRCLVADTVDANARSGVFLTRLTKAQASALAQPRTLSTVRPPSE